MEPWSQAMEPSPNCSQATAEGGLILNIGLIMLLSAVITLGNTISLLVFLGSRQFRNPQGYLKASLATADLAVGVLVIPFSVYTEIQELLVVPQSGPMFRTFPRAEAQPQGFDPCLLVGPVFAGCTLVSVFTIFLLSVERSVTVLRPLHKNVVVTEERTAALILLSWLLCFSLAAAPLFLSTDITLEYSRCSKMCNYVLSPPATGSHRGVQVNGSNVTSIMGVGWEVMLLFPAFDFSVLGATCLLNVTTFAAVRRFCRSRRKVGTVASPPYRGPSFSDLRAAKTILILTTLLSASVAPVAVLVVGSVAGFAWCSFSLYAFWILACSSGWNVLIYGLRDRRFRQRARELCLGWKKTGRGAEVNTAPRSPTVRANPGHSGICGEASRRYLTSDHTVAVNRGPEEDSSHICKQVAVVKHNSSASAEQQHSAI